MTVKPGSDLPKVPPFHIVDGSGKRVEPSNNLPPSPKPPAPKNGQLSERGMLSVMILVITSASIAISMAGGAWISISILQEGVSNQDGLAAKVMATGLAYVVGWVVGLFGIRMLGNLILPFFVKVYTWFTVIGICVLQIEIISKLFKQVYSLEKFVMYMTMFSVGIFALIGLHLLIENQNLRIFSFPMLTICLAHLFIIVIHYVFFPSENVNYEYLWGDIIFFLLTSVVSTLMLAHLGILDGLRDSVGSYFRKKTDHLVPPY